MINPETLNIFSLPSLELSQRDCLPEKRVIYFVASLDKIYYIGKAINLKTRWKQHHRYSQVENEEGVLIYWMEVEKNEDLSAWETLLIQYFEPSLNGTPVDNPDFQRRSYQDFNSLNYKITLSALIEIEGAVEVELKRIIGETCKTYGWILHALEIMPDHVVRFV
ncbi:MAG: GIY-YIG nuclease family protein [Gloeotrichia echinulata DEX184]|nr:GIY-YIG nuclease family protein [Gloeotrichia echinulata DEX184]